MSAVRAARHSHVSGDGYFAASWGGDVIGCNLLRDRINQCFADFEHRFCLEPGEGKYLLMDTGLRTAIGAGR